VEHQIATDFNIRLAGISIAAYFAKGEIPPRGGQEIISFISIQHRPAIKDAANRGWK